MPMTALLGGLVFLPWLIWTLIIQAHGPEKDWRESVVGAALGWGMGVVMVTEGLSLFHRLTPGPMLWAWIAINLASAAGLWRARHQLGKLPRLSFGEPLVRCLAAASGGLLLLAFAAAACCPPNTSDALSYHLPRQIMWLQQGGVQHFVTTDDRMLMMPPFAEMIQVQAMGLAGGDYWANIPQWLAYGLGAVAASLLAREIGAARRGQWLAAVIFLTLPMAYLEASSAKNDLLVAVLLGLFMWFALRSEGAPRRSTAHWLGAGVSLGLALATKPTAFIFALPVILIMAPALKRDPRGLLLIIVTVLVAAGPHWVRNQEWYGSPLGIHRAADGGEQEMKTFSWRGAASNLVRNASLHFSTPSPALNAQLTSAVKRWHEKLGQDVSDPRTTLLMFDFEVAWHPQNDVTAGAPIQALLTLAAILGILVSRQGNGLVMRLTFVVILGAILYCLLIKWQPWAARLHLPLFLAGAALIAWSAEKIGQAACWLAAITAVFGWVPSAQCDIRPVFGTNSIFTVPRWENYFRTHPDDRPRTEACLRAVAAADARVVKVVSKYGVGYPFMRGYLNQSAGRGRFWRREDSDIVVPPEAIVVIDRFGTWLPLYFHPEGSTERYRAAGVTDPFGVYLPESVIARISPPLPLPNFVGWEHAVGLGRLEPARAGTESIEVRRMDAPTMRLRFRPESRRMSLRLEVVNREAQPIHVEVQLNGARLARLTFEASSARQALEVPLAVKGDLAELSLVTSGDEPPGLIFCRLQLTNSP